MVKNKLLLLLVAVAAMTTQGAGAQTVVTFDGATNGAPTTRGAFTLTQGDISLSCSDGLGGTDHYRFYQNSAITVSSASGTIVKVVFNCLGAGTATYGAGNISLKSGGGEGSETESKVYTWTGATDEVIFNCNKQVRASSVEVTFVEAGTSGEVTLTDDFTFWPVMNNAPQATFTVTPPAGGRAYYTTDGSQPSATHGTLVTAATAVTIHETTVVKAIGTDRNGGNATSTLTRTYTLGRTVSSIDEFKKLDEGEEARLFLSDEMNARVLFVNGSQAFVRDNTGAICIYGVNTNPALKYNQHIAGWIIGKYTNDNGLPELAGTARTTGKELLIAEPVTEENTLPRSISREEYDNFVADWVTVPDVRQGDEEMKLYNRYNYAEGTDFIKPYDGMLMDVTGIATPYGTTRQVVPIVVDDVDVTIVVPVVNELLDFEAPTTALTSVPLRYKRTFTAGQWTPVTVPFNWDNFEGKVARFTGATGSTLEFSTTGGNNLTAGDIYLVKPAKDFNVVNLDNATLNALSEPHHFVDDDITFSLTGAFSPTVAEVGTTLAFGTDGGLSPVSDEITLNGTYAWLNALNGSTAFLVSIDGEVIGKVVKQGDVNGDGNVNGSDVTALYEYILNKKEAKGNLDVNGDKVVNGTDVTVLYNILLNN